MPLGNCATVTRSLSDELDRPLSALATLRVRAHLLTCTGCRAYASQIATLRALSRHVAGHDDVAEPPNRR
ncbi:zf-HC2 domain-containing protein [Pandoraea aquatica]|uniref:zf-HC2 domain-containing protein n=1 Tax=Pandoraea aquatica TaxID=2508290 RepID=UPI001241A564|nr:zf-HC2 domain-containing protein [Pandoraea aquatica]